MCSWCWRTHENLCLLYYPPLQLTAEVQGLLLPDRLDGDKLTEVTLRSARERDYNSPASHHIFTVQRNNSKVSDRCMMKNCLENLDCF